MAYEPQYKSKPSIHDIAVWFEEGYCYASYCVEHKSVTALPRIEFNEAWEDAYLHQRNYIRCSNIKIWNFRNILQEPENFARLEEEYRYLLKEEEDINVDARRWL